METVWAVDWSGAKSGARRRIWVAQLRGDELVRLENGRSRDEVIRLLVEEAERDPSIVVGLDFAFGLPGWFAGELGVANGRELWSRVEAEGERWLRECRDPFWGRPGHRRPELPAHLRRTEQEIGAVGGIRPKSVFQVGGAGAVGTGSLRGMPHLLTLADAGFAIWPFDPPGRPLAMEIWPRLLTGPVVKSDPAARRAWLAANAPSLASHHRDAAAASEDAFDAAASALVLSRERRAIAALTSARDPQLLLEGAIFRPSAGMG